MLFYFILSVISFIGVMVYRKIALKVNILDVPNERSSHTIPTPRGAGVAVSGVWFLALCYMYFIGKIVTSSLFFALVSGVILAIIGIIDDIWNVSPKIRLAAQLLTAVLALYFLGGLKKVDLGFYTIESTWLLSVLAFIALIWFINLFNFLDGIDGYLGVETLFITAFIGFYFKNSCALSIAAVVIGFLFFNWPKAKVFMGDVGSTLLGFNIAVLAIYFQNTDVSSMVIWVMLSSLFWFDATLTLYRRFRNKERLMVAHRKHAYQRIVQSGFSHRKTLLYAIGVNIIILGLVMLALKFQSYSVIFLMVNVLFLYGIDKLIGLRKPFPRD